MPEVPAVSDPAGLVEAVNRVFDPADGPLAGAFDGFEPRSGQRRLATAVARTLATGGTLVAEAGTGIGKTLAYLVPAVLSGRPVLVSTGTRNLQDQIFYKDVPALARALGRPIRAAYMKGRTNYLCLHRLERLRESESGLDAADRGWLATIVEWADRTDTGDRAELEDLPDDSRFWADVTATSEQCLGRDCPVFADCFVTRMRDRAAEAELIVVNHHLLCADASLRQGRFGEVIPECSALIVDEAHQLEDVVTQYFGVSLSGHRLDELTRDAAQAASGFAADREDAAGELTRAIADVQVAGRRLFDAVRMETRNSGTGDRALVTPAMADRLSAARAELADALARVISLAGRYEGARDDLDAVVTRAAAARTDLEMLLSAADPAYVHFAEIRGRGTALRAAPIDASSIIRDTIVGGRHASVLTSATLAVDGGFEYALDRLGAAGATTEQIPSEFDFRRQAILYLPPGMPDPRTPEFNGAAAAVIRELLDRTRGRAFLLFTSYAAMRAVHARIADAIDWPVLVQGSAPRPALLREFRSTPHAVLLATASFWQGVDVAGDALSCVVIDRLPFASPADPLVAARIAAVAARGQQPFNDFQVPLATLTLLQGLGRLIRTRSDRGVMAVLDPRLTRMRYGQRFLASMPPATITDDLDDVDRFLNAAVDD